MEEREVASFWDQNAKVWDEGVEKGYDLYREEVSLPAFLERLGDVQGRRLLDLGCGEGHNTRIFARRGAVVVGVDISEQMLIYAREHEKRVPIGIAYYQASAARLSRFAEGSFDGVVSTLALMDMPEVESVFSEAWRVLRDGGFFQFSILHPLMTSGKGWHKSEEGKKIGLIVGDYFEGRDPTVQEWYFTAMPQEEREGCSPFRIPHFHRTLSWYVNALCRAGFVLEAFDEPYARAGCVDAVRDTCLAPYFAVFRLIKRAE